MTNTQITAERIKEQTKQKDMSVKKLLENCALGVNTVTKMSNGKDIVSQNLLKIASCLDVSTDYLLGRTENPKLNLSVSEHNEMLNKLISVYSEMDIVQKSKLLVLADEILKENT